MIELKLDTVGIGQKYIKRIFGFQTSLTQTLVGNPALHVVNLHATGSMQHSPA
jgi:hypothetical protein